MRGLAISLVILFHAHVPGFLASGTIGVTMFFTLSGFLITTLLLEERASAGRIDLVNFFRRRALRLLPALFVLVSLLIALSLSIFPWLADPSDAPVVLFYMANWVPAAGGDLGGMNHAWSLAVEEQFYLAWPLIVIVVGRFGRGPLLAAALAGVLAAVLVRMLVWDGGAGAAHAYYGSGARAGAILAGCALAIVLHGRVAGRGRPHIADCIAAILVLMSVIGGVAFHLVVPSVVACLTVVMICSVVRGHYSGWLEFAALRWLGRRSYALYLWHYPVGLALERLPGVQWWTTLVVTVGVSTALAELSWRLVEQPCSKLRRSGHPAQQRAANTLSAEPAS